LKFQLRRPAYKLSLNFYRALYIDLICESHCADTFKLSKPMTDYNVILLLVYVVG